MLGAGTAGIAKSVIGSLLVGAALGFGVALAPQALVSSPESSSPRVVTPAAPAAATAAPREARGRTPAEPREPPAAAVLEAPVGAAPKAGSARSPAPVRRKAPSSPTPAPTIAVPASSGPGLLGELAVLERVQHALRAGDGARALELLEAEPASHQLAAEHLAAEVFAACQVGQLERARRASERFLARYPTGPLSARVRTSCAGAH